MKQVKFDVRIPTELDTLGEDIDMTNDGFKVDIAVQTSIDSEVIELNEYITEATEKIVKEVGLQGASLVQIVTNMSNGLNELNRKINSSVEDLNASYNNVQNIVITKYEDVIASNQSVIDIVNEQGVSVKAKVTEFNNKTIEQLNDIQDEVKSNSSGLNKLKMLISSEREQTDGIRVFKNPSKHIKGVVNRDDMQTEDPSNPAPSNNLFIQSIKRFRGDRGPPDVSEPVKGVYYYNKFISIDDINELYNTEDYAMFDINSLSEIRLLDNVNVNITQNNSQFTWNIVNDYINTNLNISQDYPQGFNPIGVTNFTFNVAIDDIRLKNMNEWEQLSQYAFVNNNTALIKYNPNNQVDPQEITNRVIELDEYQGDGVTIYDPNEKIFINNHKYTFSEENEEYNENIEGFKSVMQTSIVPIMDRIILPEITSNKTIRYSIQDFNSIYSLSPGSQNTFRNDFIGFNTIDIPVNVNNKTVPLLATQDGIYRPTDIDPLAIGFSSVQVSTTTRSSGGGSGGSVNNLSNYTFRTNTSVPFSIDEYNNLNNTNYTGLDNVIVEVNPVREVLDVDIYNIGNYELNFGEGENIMPLMSSNNDQGIVLTGSTMDYGRGGFDLFRLFDNNKNLDAWNGFVPSGANPNGWLKIDFGNEVKEFDYVLIYKGTRVANEICTHVIVKGSNDDIDYTVLCDQNLEYENNVSRAVLDNVGEYRYYYFDFYNRNNTWMVITEMELMKYVGGYRGVNINVKNGNGLVTVNHTVDSIENNVDKNYFAVDAVQSLIPNFTSNNSNGCSIMNAVGFNHSNYWIMFNSNDNCTWVNPQTSSFILQMSSAIIPRSMFMSFTNTDSNYRRIKKFVLSGSSDNIEYKNIFLIEDFVSESPIYKNGQKYIYRDIDNNESFSYFKFEFTGSNNDWPGIYYFKLMDVPKYAAIDKVTIVNNTYSKTSDPVVSNLEPNNGRVYVNTSDSNLYPYVRRNWMTVPLEDKVITYNSQFTPMDINVSSGYYGIRSVRFVNENPEVPVCSSLFPVQQDSSNWNNGYITDGGYKIHFVYNGNLYTESNFYNLFGDWDNDIGLGIYMGNSNSFFIIEGDYSFILNEIMFRPRYMTRGNSLIVDGSKDGINYVNIFNGSFGNEINIDNNKKVCYFNNNNYFKSYRVCIIFILPLSSYLI